MGEQSTKEPRGLKAELRESRKGKKKKGKSCDYAK